MIELSLVFLVLIGLSIFATARLTRIFTYDRISEPLRLAILKRCKPESMVAYLIQCPWCMSMWFGALVGVYVILAFGWSWWLLPLLVLTFSYVSGILATKYDADEDDEVVVLESRPID